MLNKEGLLVLRFDNLQVLKETEAVVQVIGQTLLQRLPPPSQPTSPLQKAVTPLQSTAPLDDMAAHLFVTTAKRALCRKNRGS